MDEYADFRSLAAAHPEGSDFRIRVRTVEGCAVVIVAPHGGAIERGTSEIAAAIAADDLNFYAFEGLKAKGNRRLHITSTRFDEPRCLEVIQRATRILTIHGEATKDAVVFAGGRDKATCERLAAVLGARGFSVRAHRKPELQGTDPANLCNRGQSGAGVQLELSAGLRSSLFRSLTAEGCRFATPRLGEFVAAVREVLFEERAVQQ